jgi:hypothetical protein
LSGAVLGGFIGLGMLFDIEKALTLRALKGKNWDHWRCLLRRRANKWICS